MSDNNSSATASLFPGAIAFPLLIIGFLGCVGIGDGPAGCQGALNAQSAAIHEAAEFGGWIEEN